ncbi:hypothetical protein [Paenibacillus terrae]
MKRILFLVSLLTIMLFTVLSPASYAQAGSSNTYVAEVPIYINEDVKDGEQNITFGSDELEFTQISNADNTVTSDVYDSKLISPSAIDHAGRLLLTCTDVAGRMYCNWNINLEPKYQISSINFTMYFQKAGLGTWDIIGRTPINKKGSLTYFQGDQETFLIRDWGAGNYRARMTGSILTLQTGVTVMTPLNSNVVNYE